MLLVLAPPKDEVAARFERLVQSRGIAVERATAETVSLNVGLDRSGSATVELRASGAPVHAVLNRGLDIDPATQFQDSEWLAAWWAALAYFPGPVVNRPSQAGFLPELDVLSLVERVPSLNLAPMHIGSRAPPSLAGRVVNVHSARDGHFIGRDDASGDEELLQYTEFDPERTCRIILAGDKCLATGFTPPAASGAIKMLENELRARGATFSCVVLQVNSSSVELLHATSVPSTPHYLEIENDVHEALLEYLGP